MGCMMDPTHAGAALARFIQAAQKQENVGANSCSKKQTIHVGRRWSGLREKATEYRAGIKNNVSVLFPEYPGVMPVS